MGDSNPFSVVEAAKKLRQRPARIARAVKAAEGTPVKRDDAVRTIPKREHAQPSSYVPTGVKTRVFGAPMGVESPRAESAVERAARGQRNPGNN